MPRSRPRPRSASPSPIRPVSAGGGFLVYYNARTGKVSTIDGRETAPASFTPEVFIDEATGKPLVFDNVVNSGPVCRRPRHPGLVGDRPERFGSWSLNRLLRPAEKLARDGFVVDSTFNAQSAANAARFSTFPETERVYLPGGQPAAVGSTFRNPDLARSYRILRRDGVQALYRGRLGAAVVQAAQEPATQPGISVYAGQITKADLRDYRTRSRKPVKSRYRGLDVYGMPVPSSGGIAVGEALNLLEAYDRTGTSLSAADQGQYLHRLGEATATAFADRNRYVGDVPGVPVRELRSQRYANERACLFDPAQAQPRPIPFGNPDGDYADCSPANLAQPAVRDDHGTTHLVATDRWGNVASYTLTIEQTGGSGITVPGYGFLLNNELTDFNFAPLQTGVPDPNLPGAGQTATVIDEPDHSVQARQAVAGRRIARRRQHHHHRHPGHRRLRRPRSVPGRRHRRPALLLPQRGRLRGRTGDRRRCLGRGTASTRPHPHRRTPKSVRRPRSGSCPTAASWPRRRPPDAAAAPQPSSDPRANVAKLASPDRCRPRSTAQQYFRQGAPYR